jgi:hypothetical protein
MRCHLVLATLSLLLLTACEPAPAPSTHAAFSFTKATTTPIRLAAGRMEWLNHYQAPLRAPNIEHTLPTTPTVAFEQWLSQRLNITQDTPTLLTIRLREASIVESPLPKTHGFKGLITDDQDVRADAKLAVTYQLKNIADGKILATGDVDVTRFRTFNEHATVDERERAYHAMIDALLVDMERETRLRLQQFFAPWMR